MGESDAMGDGAQLRGGALDGDVFQAREDPQRASAAIFAAAGTKDQGDPELGLGGPEGRKLKARGHHADHLVAGAADGDGAADDPTIAAEVPLPRAMAQQHDAARLGALVLGPESAADDRRHSEHRKQRRGRAQAFDLFRAARAGQGGTPDFGRGDRLKHILLVAPVEICAGRGGKDRAAAQAALLDENEMFGMRVSKRPQQDAVDHAEHGRGGADAEREHEHRGHGEARGLDQRTNGIPQVGAHRR
jgi:hypothetical protein